MNNEILEKLKYIARTPIMNGEIEENILQDNEAKEILQYIEKLNKELADIKKFKNSLLIQLEKRTLQRDKLKERLKGTKKMKDELKEFNIKLEDIEENDYLFNNINEAVEKLKVATLKDRFEVVLNNNLIETKDKYTGFRTILGCRVSYDNLDKSISFIVREDAKPTYEELEMQLQQKENIIKEVREYITSYESIETIQQFDHNKNNKDLDYSTIDEMTRRYMIVHDKILEILDKVD